MQVMSLLQFAKHLGKMPAHVLAEQQLILRHAARQVQREAQRIIGHYQQAAGPFAAWAPLSQATLYGGVTPTGYHYQGKVTLGYAPPDNPLLRTHALQQSISWTANLWEARVGSAMPYAHELEFGTSNMPPRSFLGMALVHEQPHILRMAGLAVAGVLSGHRISLHLPTR